MERSCKVFRKIESASRRVVAVANKYADRMDLNGVPRCHFQLEEDMRRIYVACDCLAHILDKPPPQQGPAVDIRIQDWLDTDEPQECLRTLSQMESLLQQDAASWMPWIFRRGRGSTATQDKIKEAVDLFNSCKGHFHFLFSTEVWNNERPIHKRLGIPQSGRDIVQGESGLLLPVQTETDVHQGGNADRVTHGGPDIIPQGTPAFVETDTETIAPETVSDQDRDTATRKKHEVKTDKQREEEAKKLEEILNWLDGLNCAEKQDITLSLRQEDTCQWLFDTTQYGRWRDSEIESLWLQGKPGAGKSVLMSSVIHSLREARREGEILTFFYCDFRNERSTSSAAVMRSILSQLFRQLRGRSIDLGNVLDDLSQAKEWGGGTLGNAQELARFAARAARLWNRKPLVIVDALDECKDVRKLIQGLMVIKGDVRLFVASRPLHVIVDDLSDVPSVSMDDMADELLADIELHVTRELDARRRLRGLDSGFKTEIRSILCDKADGMFRWVQCSIDTLDRCVTREQVRNALNTLPKGLDETYERILISIDAETLAGQLAQRALIWLVAALRPLRLDEIMEALSINLETRTLDSDLGPMHSGALLDACGSLVTYSAETRIIILSHSSVKEYLVGEFTRAKIPRYHISSEHAHLLLVRSCMCYISMFLDRAKRPVSVDISGSSSTTVSPMSLPLLDYALDDALDHFIYLGSTFESALRDVIILAEDIQRHSWTWDHVCIPARWEISMKPHWPAARHDLLLYIIVAFAPNSLVNTLFRRTAVKPKGGTNPLVYAAYFNKDEHARTLLSRGVELHCRGWETDRFFQSLPIEVAFRNRHYGMVALFVEEGSTIPQYIFAVSFSKSNRFADMSPFDSAFSSFTARILFKTDEFAENISDCLNEEVLHAMKTNQLLVFMDITEEDLIAIIRRFIQVADEHSITLDLIKDAFFRLAVVQGYFSVVRYMLTLSDKRFPSDLLVTLPLYSGRWKTSPMIQFLMTNGADVLARSSDGNTVLYAILRATDETSFYMADANEGDILEAVKLVVDYGCDPLEADCRGYIPLYIAVERGYLSVARYLSTLGASFPADLFITQNFMLLHGWESARMIRFLVDSGVNPLARTSAGESVFHILLNSIFDDSEALEAVKLLVGYGCDLFPADYYGDPPLYLAIRSGHISVAQYLVTLGAPLSPDILVMPNLLLTTAHKIRFLIENGADPLARTIGGDSVLHIALESESLQDDNEALDIVELLVSYGCDPFQASGSGNTPLCTAVRRGHISVARYLLALGAPLPSDLLVTLDTYGWLQLKTVCTIRFLVENGANPLAHNSDGDSVLHIVLRSFIDDHEVVEFLVSYGCNPFETNPCGNTPLHIAVGQGQISVARYLLSIGSPLPPDLLVTLDNDYFVWATVRMIRLLVENGVDVFAHASNGDSAIHVALRCSNDGSDVLEAVKLLVSYGCDPFHVNHCGNTTLHLAVDRGRISAARYLLTLGVPLPSNILVTLDYQRWLIITPMIPFLLENGADALAYNDDGDSVLHIVLRALHLDGTALKAVKLLTSCGCDPLKPNSRGNTPLHIAVERGHISTAQHLLSIGVPLPPDLLVTLDRDRLRRTTAPMIHFLVEAGVNLLARATDGDSVLHIVLQSCDSGDEALEVLKLLVHHGCDPLEANSLGHTPLRIAIEKGHFFVVSHLLSLGAPLPPDPFLAWNRGSHWEMAHIMVICLLIQRGVNVPAYTSDGDSILHIMLQFMGNDSGALEIVRFLVDHGCDPLEANSRRITPLHIAIEQGYISTVQHLLTIGAPLSSDVLVTLDRGLSRWATRRTIQFLLENGVDVLAHASNGDSVLHTALRCVNEEEDILEAVKLLINHGCDPLEANSRGNTPLHVAIEQDHISTAQYLLGLSAPPPSDLLVTLDRDQSRWSTMRMVRFLVANKVDVLAHTSGGDSALHLALRCINNPGGVFEVTRFLVRYGCNPVEANSRGETPLHVAAERNYISAAQYLILRGASVLTKTLNGDTVLHFATRAVYPYHDGNADNDRYALEAVRFFVGCGCERAAPNDSGQTPLHIAVDLGYIKTIRYLLSLNIPLPHDILFTAIQSEHNSAYCRYIVSTLVTSGCDIRIHNSMGDIPLEVAIRKGKMDVVEYLLSVVSAHNPSYEVLLSATTLAPPSAQSEMRRMLSDHLTRSESPEA